MERIDVDKHAWVVATGPKFDTTFCHVSLLENLVERIVDHHGSIIDKVEGVSKFSFDLPGMCMTDRDWTDIDFYSATISVPVGDYGYICEKLAELKPREWAGTEVYLLQGFWRRILLSSFGRKSLLRIMRGRYDEMEKRAQLEREEFMRRVESAKAKGARVVTDQYPGGMKL